MNLRYSLLLSVLLVTLTSWTSAGAGVTGHDKVVMCYWGTWAYWRPGAGKFETSNIDGNLCTHLIYSFAGLDDTTWTIKSLDTWLDLEDGGGLNGYQKAVALRTEYPHLKIMIAIGGWNEGSEKYSQMAEDAQRRSTFVTSVVVFLRKFGFEGLDMDWEYPTFRGGSEIDKDNFILLLKELRDAFRQDNFLLTAAIGASKEKIDGSYNVVKMYEYLDFVNVMCYDYHGKWDRFTGHNSPLGPRPDEAEDQKILNVMFTINYLLEKGGILEKTVLGVPLYGRTFFLEEAGNYKMGAPTLENSFAGYNNLSKFTKQSTRTKHIYFLFSIRSLY